jgi:predicted RND superfamily exporter protein
MVWLSEFIIKHRKIVIIISVIISLVFGYFATKLKINPNVTSYLPKNDPIVKTFNHISDEYAGNSLAIVMLEADNVFSKDLLKQLNYLTSEFKLIDGVSNVTSLINIIDIKKGDEGIEVGQLIDEYNLPQTDAELQKLKYYVLSREMYQGHIVSDDAKTTLIICRLQSNIDQIKTVRKIKSVAQSINFNGKIYYAGVPFQVMEINDIIRSDLLILIPIVCLLIAGFLFFSFRSAMGVIIPMLSVLISIILTLGVMSILKIPLTIISNIIPVILVTCGSAYSIHILSKFYEDRFSGIDKLAQAQKSLKDVGIPVLLAAVTTIAGFISFVFGSYLTMIKQFGIFSAIGILFALIVSVTFVPALLTVFPDPKVKIQKPNDNTKEKPTRIGFTARLTQLILKNRIAIIVSTIIIVVLAIIGIPRIKRETDMLDYFRAKSSIRMTEQIMKNKFGGSVPLQILVQGDIQDPKVLNEMKKLEDFLTTHPEVHNPQSIADLIEEMSYVIGEGKIVPESREKVTNLWFLLDGEEIMTQFVNQDKSEAVIQAMVAGFATKHGKELLKNIQQYIGRVDTTTCKFFMTGSPLIYNHLDKSILISQIESLVIAIVLVYICLAVLLHSAIGGLIGLVPITFTLFVIFGFMGFTGMPLDVATVLVGSVSIGVGIDYSIHFVSRFRKEIKQGRNKFDALEETLKTTGKAILINVLTVTIGFLVLMLAKLIPLQRFGILVAITMISSGLGAITILPIIILSSKTKFINK